MENRSQFLKQTVITKQDIMDKVLKPNNYDGQRSFNDL